MKIFTLLILSFSLAFISCETKKVIPPTEPDINNEPIVSDPVVMGTQTISMCEYYVKVQLTDGEVDYQRREVEGTAEFMQNDDGNFMTITLAGSNSKIYCQEESHPVLDVQIFVEIGGESENREH